MTLTTNKGKRDAILAGRVAAIGGTLIEVDSGKYGGDLTSYYLYMTFPNDAGPAIHHRHGRELATPYHAYRVIIKGGHDALDAITGNPAHLAIHAYRERQDFHYTTLKIGDLQRALDYARKEYGRVSTAAAIASMRHQDEEKAAATASAAWWALKAAVDAYDAAHAAMEAVIGEWPKSDDNYYPRH